MSKDITNIANWKDNYPFLNKVSEVYDEFNNDEYAGKSRNSYESLCHTIIINVKGDLEKHKDICQKLMRNLKYHSVIRKDYELSSDRCNILFHWLYNFLGKGKITYDIINKCFETYDYYSSIKGNIYKKCHYFKDEKFVEPTKITLLDIFNDNMSIIKTTLMNQDLSISTPGRKYVCECVKIYKQMNDEYCFNEQGKSDDYSFTCLKLKQFKDSYNFFRSTLNDLSPSLPSVNDLDNEFLFKCPSEQPNQVLTHEVAITPEGASGIEIFQGNVDHGRKLTHDLPAHTVTVDSQMKKTITTTIGTVAGASSLLAFLYKFTPAGRLVNPKLRRTTGMINNNFYGEEANGMLFDGNEHNGFNSYNIGYEAV